MTVVLYGAAKGANPSQVTRTESGNTSRVTYIECGSLIDGVSDLAKKNVTLEVVGSTFRAINEDQRAQTIKRGVGSELIDLTAETCLPGLVDAHTHVLEANSFHPSDSAAAGASRILEHGFTTIRNLGTSGGGSSDLEMRKIIDEGLGVGPRVQISIADSSPQHTFGAPGPDGRRQAVEERIDRGTDWIKLWIDKSATDATLVFTSDELSTIVRTAHNRNRQVAAHALWPGAVHAALLAGVDSIEHGIRISEEDLKFMAANGVYYVPTPYVFKYAADVAGQNRDLRREQFKLQNETFERALKAGVRIAFGTDVGAAGWVGNPAKQFSILVQHGMTPVQAIFAATSTAARMLRMAKDVGSVKVGSYADLIAAAGDPLTDISVLERVDFVMKNGIVYKGR